MLRTPQEITLFHSLPFAAMRGNDRPKRANGDVPVETIGAALRTFAHGVIQTPERFNVLEVDGRTVLVDSCHNLHGLEAMADFIKRMDVAHTVAAIAMPGDRTDEHITAFGRLAAQICDEPGIGDTRAEDRRGRTPGEVPALRQAAATAAGLSAAKIRHRDEAREAARSAIANGGQKGGRDSLVALLMGSGATFGSRGRAKIKLI